MKRLQLPKNKLARLAINIAFVVAWFHINMGFLIVTISRVLRFFNPDINLLEPLGVTLHLTSMLLPMLLGTRYIWAGRIRPRPRITTSMDD